MNESTNNAKPLPTWVTFEQKRLRELIALGEERTAVYVRTLARLARQPSLTPPDKETRNDCHWRLSACKRTIAQHKAKLADLTELFPGRIA